MAREMDACPACGRSYDAFRTGETFASVKSSMWTASTNPEDWCYRTRRMVLGCWHEMKVKMFRSHVGECEHYARLEAAEKAASRKPRRRSSVHANP